MQVEYCRAGIEDLSVERAIMFTSASSSICVAILILQGDVLNIRSDCRFYHVHERQMGQASGITNRAPPPARHSDRLQ